MMPSSQLPQWAPRVKQTLIQRLYESDASGLLDEDLVDEVGWALLYRCQSFIAANAAVAGSAPCPACEANVSHHSGRDDVIQFLNQLSVGSASTPGVSEQREAWRKVINEGADYWKDERLHVRSDE